MTFHTNMVLQSQQAIFKETIQAGGEMLVMM